MPYHIIVKAVEAQVALKLPELFKGYPVFMVEEKPDDVNCVHWHCWVGCDWKQDKLRRAIDKVRDAKNHGVSVRSWDDNLIYFCKGGDPHFSIPEDVENLPCVVKYNTVEKMTNRRIWELHVEYWSKWQDPKVNMDIKEPKLLDELVDMCRDKDMTVTDVAQTLIDIVYSKNGKKMFCNKSVAQCYIRTALMYTKDGHKYRKKLLPFCVNNIYL